METVRSDSPGGGTSVRGDLLRPRDILDAVNRLVQDYISINHEIVWNGVEHELPTFRPFIEAAIAALDPRP